MNEGQATEGATSAPTAQDIGNGIQPTTDSPIERAELILKRIEEANRKNEELVKRQEAIIARNMIAGRSVAGEMQKTPQQLEQEHIDLEASKMLRLLK